MSGTRAGGGLQEVFGLHASAHDVARSPEHGYHLFVLGLLVLLEGEYEVRSNREAGFGRYDILIKPKQAGRPGVVLELKAKGSARWETALAAAHDQIRAKSYAAELRSAGASPIRSVAIVGSGKRIRCRFEDVA